MNVTELLVKTVDTKIKDIAVNITTITDFFAFCYIEYEDQEKLGIYLVGEDMHERFLIINKEQIVSINVVYEQDLKITEDKEDIMFQ